jgi:soluble lytic murein transglycosylase-like protein
MGKVRAACAAATLNLALILPAGMASAHGLDQVQPFQTASIDEASVTGSISQEDGDSDGISGPYAALITKYAKKYGVSPELADAVVRIESNFNPKARGSAGEIGLMQIKPSTARMMGYSGSAKGLYDPSTNIEYGMKYLAMAQDLGDGTTCSTILKYNAGHGATRMNPVSKRYCGKVLSYLD